MTAIEAVLSRERVVVAAGIAALAVLAWVYLWMGAGMGMSALEMTRATLFPHREADVAGDMAMQLWIVVLMWWVMMIAMMTPSAAPLVLLYGRVASHHAGNRPGGTFVVPAGFLISGYLLAWLVFSIAAALAQSLLESTESFSRMMLWSKSAVLSAAVLAAAGLYQLSPLKQACLVQCRSPVQFLTRHWRPGRWGALLLGARHGAFCVGCCWMLMALLFVGGVMNLLWIAALTLFVLVEKLAPAGAAIGKWTGVAMLAWAAVTLVA